MITVTLKESNFTSFVNSLSEELLKKWELKVTLDLELDDTFLDFYKDEKAFCLFEEPVKAEDFLKQLKK